MMQRFRNRNIPIEPGQIDGFQIIGIQMRLIQIDMKPCIPYIRQPFRFKNFPEKRFYPLTQKIKVMTFQLIDGVIDNTAAFHRIIDPSQHSVKICQIDKTHRRGP